MILAAIALARAADWEVGVGVRATDTIWAANDTGFETFVRYPLAPAWTLEGGVFLNPFETAPSALAEALGIPARVRAEVASGRVLVDWSFAPRAKTREITGGVRALAGLEVRGVDTRTSDPGLGLTAIPAVDPGLAVLWGPAAGIAFDAWLGRRVGVRWTGLARYAIEEEAAGERLPNGEPVPTERVLTGSVAWSLDGMVAF